MLVYRSSLVFYLLSSVSCVVSHVCCVMFSVGCLQSDIYCLLSRLGCLVCGVWCLVSLPVQCDMVIATRHTEKTRRQRANTKALLQVVARNRVVIPLVQRVGFHDLSSTYRQLIIKQLLKV